ncbi:MAG: laccase domain-containing protein [Candidatus Microsaccharimonas sp.]
MSFNVEANNSTEPTPALDPRRYEKIEQANLESWYLTQGYRPFEAFQSFASAGPARVDISKLSAKELAETAAAKRVITGGNMSPLGPYGPIEMTDEQRVNDAKDNMAKLFESLSISAESVHMLFPERDYTTPLTVIDIDAQPDEENTTFPRRVSTSGDFIYTRDSNKILAARPADCPIMFASADTPEGKIYMLVHYAWQGAANHYVEQTAVALNALGVDTNSMNIYLTPGGQAENYPYTNYPEDPRVRFPDTEGLFVNVVEKTNEDGAKVWDFSIDTPKFVYDQVIKKIGVDPTQVFCDTSDTSALNSGYSSHGRSRRLADQGESNTRDIVIMRPAAH